MAAIARALSHAMGTDVDVEIVKTVAMFCGAGLFVSLLMASYGLDLSAGFFWKKTPVTPAGSLRWPDLATHRGELSRQRCHDVAENRFVPAGFARVAI
jgi:hypothetical protein